LVVYVERAELALRLFRGVKDDEAGGADGWGLYGTLLALREQMLSGEP